MMEYLRFGLALLFVLGLIGACSWFGKRMGLAPRVRGAGGRNRLSVIEVQAVDARRKLVLIRRDTVEHLILLNGDRDLLIESSIDARADIKENSAPEPHRPAKLSRILPFNGNSNA